MPLADFGFCCAMNEFGQKLMCLFYFVTYNVYWENIVVVKENQCRVHNRNICFP